MNVDPSIERSIREVLRTETSAIRMSHRLFSADGLFNQIAHTEQERRLLIQTPLFQEAHGRYRELVTQEEAAFFGPATSSGQSGVGRSQPLPAKT
jgi:hypothetical protein